jgi:hypothetical protein
MYTIKQTETKKAFFGLITREIVKEYKFATYIEAVKFALFEQIKYIYKGNKRLNVFKLFYNIAQFNKHAKNNPLHFLNLSNSERVNLDLYYKILIDKNIIKLRKH